MPILKYIIFAATLVTAIVLKTSVGYVNEDLIHHFQGYILLPFLLSFIYHHQFIVSVVCELIITSQIISGVLLYPRNYIKIRKERLIKDLCAKLFNNNPIDHRVTLFKEVNYSYAVWRHIRCLCYHLIRPRYFFRFKLHLMAFPLPGNYLIVYIREGSYKTSRTMFRVEENEVKKCQGALAGINGFSMACLAVTEFFKVVGAGT